MRIGLGTLVIGGLVALLAVRGMSGGEGGMAGSVVGHTPGGLAPERAALDIGGGAGVYAATKACLKEGVKSARACLSRPGGSSGGGGGGTAEDNAKGKKDDGDTATKDTTPPTTPPQAPPAPAPAPAPTPAPAPNPDEKPPDEQAATNPLGRTQFFAPEPRPGDTGRFDPGDNGRSDLLIPMPGAIRN